MRGMYLPLSNDERDALVQLAEREKRDPRQQAALLIRQALERLGLLRPAPTTSNPIQETQNERY